MLVFWSLYARKIQGYSSAYGVVDGACDLRGVVEVVPGVTWVGVVMAEVY